MSRRAGLAAAVLSLFVLALVRGGGGGPPLYDGLCTPPSYILFGASPGPPSRSQTFTASDLAGTFELADNDSTPQAQIIVGANSLAPTPGNTTVTVSITPVKPPASKPAGTIDGNVYDFEARSGGQPVNLAPGHPATVVLEATSAGGPQLAVEHFDGTRWSAPSKSFQSGCGTTYQVNTSTLGLFALVAPGQASPGGSGGSGGGGGGATVVIVVVVVVLVVLAAVIAAVRMSRRRGRTVKGKRRRR